MGTVNRLDALRDMRLFVEIVEAGSLRRAAERLEMPVSSVSRRLGELERGLGLQLLHRTTRRMELTESGRVYHERCTHILQQVDVTHEELAQLKSRPTGVLRFSMPVDFGLLIIEPLLVAFALEHPGLSFEVDMSPQLADLASGEVDLVLRVGPPRDPDFVARRIAELPASLHASPQYLQRHGTPTHPRELVQHECFAFKDPNWSMRHGETGEEVRVAVRSRIQVNNPGMQVRLARRGFGIVRLPEVWLSQERELGSLVPVLPQWRSASVPVHALTTTRAVPARVRLFLDFLVEKLRTP